MRPAQLRSSILHFLPRKMSSSHPQEFHNLLMPTDIERFHIVTYVLIDFSLIPLMGRSQKYKLLYYIIL